MQPYTYAHIVNKSYYLFCIRHAPWQQTSRRNIEKQTEKEQCKKFDNVAASAGHHSLIFNYTYISHTVSQLITRAEFKKQLH